MINKEKVLIGSDFEFFLRDMNTGKIVSAIPFNVGTKQMPEQLEKDGCCIQRDGVLQECNVPPVSIGAAGEFWKNVQYVKDYLETKLAPKGLELLCCASATLDADQMDNEEALALGCDSDFNAWDDGNVNPKPKNKNKNFRTSGCHIHMSYEEADIDTSIELVKLFDLYCTVPFILIDKDKERRKLYGKAGSFRLQQWGDVYGVEFRQLSNRCLDDEGLIEYVFNQVDSMIDHFNKLSVGSIDADRNKIVKCINTSNEKLATELCEKYNIFLPIEYVEDGNMLELA